MRLDYAPLISVCHLTRLLVLTALHYIWCRYGICSHRTMNGHERLEVDPSKHSGVDLANIVPRRDTTREGPLESWKLLPTMTEHITFSADFVDDPDVPPLIWASESKCFVGQIYKHARCPEVEMRNIAITGDMYCQPLIHTIVHQLWMSLFAGLYLKSMYCPTT